MLTNFATFAILHTDTYTVCSPLKLLYAMLHEKMRLITLEQNLMSFGCFCSLSLFSKNFWFSLRVRLR